jgi:hypothetical protein
MRHPANQTSSNVLTREIANRFLADPESVNLSQFTGLEDAAAGSQQRFITQ